MARPWLRQALGEDTPTVFETGLWAALRSRVDKKEAAAAQGLGVESILAARFLAAMAAPAKGHGQPPGSMQSKFTAYAATSFAVLALLGAQKNASAGLPPAY